MSGTLKDPVAKKAGEIQEKQDSEEMKTFDISNLSIEDFKPLQPRMSSAPHPFDGYPNNMVKVGEVQNGPNPKARKDIMVPSYAVVALNPKEAVFEDPSGNGQSVMKNGKEVRVNIYAPHNRCVVDYEAGGVNVDICFDRTIELEEGKSLARCAFIKSHSARCQVMFKLDIKGERIQIDNRYLLLDTGQASRLRRVFEMIINPKIKNERLARAISGESEEDIDDLDG